MSNNFCIACGDAIPEGRQVCPACEKRPVDTQPCKDCPERHINCHATCSRYKAFREWYGKITAKERVIRKYF